MIPFTGYPNEDFLEKVFGSFALAKHLQAVRVHPTVVSFIERDKGLLTSAFELLHQFFIAWPVNMRGIMHVWSRTQGWLEGFP